METENKDELYMRRALDEAQRAFDEGEIPVGAVVVCRDRVISRTHNLTETLRDVTAHAEMQAITSAADMLGGKYLKDCTLYVTVEPWAGRKSVVWSMARQTRSGASPALLPRPFIPRRK